MQLNDEEQDILAGKIGPLPQQALQHQIKVGNFFGARDLVPVSQAHIMADTESLGEAGVRWLEQLASSTEGQRTVRIPTITDPRGTDFAHAAFLGQTADMLDLERRAIAAFVQLGVSMTDTCINYQTIQAPIYNEHVAFGDTGVVIYSNSICGARSNFEGGPSALAAGITGRTPRYGFHLPDGRRATLKICTEFTPDTLNDWGALGGVIGRGEYEWAAGLRAEIMNLTWLFVTAVGATILLWNRSFLTLWVGPENYAGFWTNLLVVIATVQTALVRTDAYVLDATLQPRLRVWVAAVAGVAIVGFSIALTPSLGIVGVCLGVLMGRLVQTIAYPLLVDRCLHRPARLRIRSIARPLTVMLVMFGATATVGERVLAHHWLGWAAGVALSLAIMMAVAFVAGLPAEARGTVLGRLRTMLATARG